MKCLSLLMNVPIASDLANVPTISESLVTSPMSAPAPKFPDLGRSILRRRRDKRPITVARNCVYVAKMRLELSDLTTARQGPDAQFSIVIAGEKSLVGWIERHVAYLVSFPRQQ